MRWIAIVALAPAVALSPAAAQYEDEQTRELEQQDRRYYERYRAAEESARDEADEDQLAAYLQMADELIRDRHYRSDTTENFKVQSDDPRLDVEEAAGLLERFRTAFEEFWAGRTRLGSYDRQSRVFLFYSFYRFNQLIAGDWRFSHFRPAGHYRRQFDVITVHTDANSETLSSTLVHEAAHQLVEQRIFGEGDHASLWVAEGLASYFGFTRHSADEGFVWGEVGGNDVALLRDVKSRAELNPRAGLKIVKGWIRKSAANEEPGPVERVVGIQEPSTFYGVNASANYAASWLLCHFLFHGDGGKHAPGFVAYLEAEARNEGGPAALVEHVGLDLAELEAGLAAHVKTLKVR